MTPMAPPRKRIIYPDSDGKPMAENMEQYQWISTIKHGIEHLFRNNPNVVVAGDFNHTPYTPRFARLAAEGRLLAARHPGLWPITWRAQFRGVPVLDRLFGLPIDQVLVNDHFAVRTVAIGPELGSDHLPVTVELAPRRR